MGKGLGYIQHYWGCNICVKIWILTAYSWAFVFCKARYWAEKFGHIWKFSVTKVMSEKAIRRRAISQWGAGQGKWVDLGATQGPENPWGKVVQQGSRSVGQVETGQVAAVYKRRQTRVEPQRQSVSQAATTCLDTSRRPLGPIPVSWLFDGCSKLFINTTLFLDPSPWLEVKEHIRAEQKKKVLFETKT